LDNLFGDSWPLKTLFSNLDLFTAFALKNLSTIKKIFLSIGAKRVFYTAVKLRTLSLVSLEIIFHSSPRRIQGTGMIEQIGAGA